MRNVTTRLVVEGLVDPGDFTNHFDDFVLNTVSQYSTIVEADATNQSAAAKRSGEHQVQLTTGVAANDFIAFGTQQQHIWRNGSGFKARAFIPAALDAFIGFAQTADADVDELPKSGDDELQYGFFIDNTNDQIVLRWLATTTTLSTKTIPYSALGASFDPAVSFATFEAHMRNDGSFVFEINGEQVHVTVPNSTLISTSAEARALISTWDPLAGGAAVAYLDYLSFYCKR